MVGVVLANFMRLSVTWRGSLAGWVGVRPSPWSEMEEAMGRRGVFRSKYPYLKHHTYATYAYAELAS